MSETQPSLTITVQNKVPLDVLDLTASFAAFADEYRRYSGNDGTRLYVEHIREGSIVAELVPLAGAAVPLIPLALDAVAPFMGHWSGLLTGLANYGRDIVTDANLRSADKASLRNARAFVQPAVNGNPINVQGDNATINQFNINVTQESAGEITRNATHLLARALPDESGFQNEPMTLYQVRDARAGDMGFIDRFADRPKKLTFASEAVKNEVLHSEAPFDMFFFVSGLVKTAGGEVASYHIQKIDSIVAKDAA